MCMYSRLSGSEAQITIVGCGNASGSILPPMVIFDGAHLDYELTNGEVSGTLYGLSIGG